MGQRSNFQNAPIELKIVRNDPNDLLSMLKIQLRSLKVIKGVIGVKGQIIKMLKQANLPDALTHFDQTCTKQSSAQSTGVKRL